ncbi:MAG: hypothetical protein J0L86_03230 [Flavobacteriales bacterium]|nr:hypothetical protein [Flavobacteriales bacterium]
MDFWQKSILFILFSILFSQNSLLSQTDLRIRQNEYKIY